MGVALPPHRDVFTALSVEAGSSTVAKCTRAAAFNDRIER